MSNLENNTTELEKLLEIAQGLPSVEQGGSGFLCVTATANLTSETGGVLTDISPTYSEIEAAIRSGKCVTLDIDIGQMNEGQRATLCLISYVDGAVIMFSGTFYTGQVCMQMSCTLTADGYSVIYLNQLPTMEDLSELGGDNTFYITAQGTITMGSNGLSLEISRLTSEYDDIVTAFTEGKRISFIANTNTGAKMSFHLVSVDAEFVNFSCIAHAGSDFLLIGVGVKYDNTINVFHKVI